ncbi:hypothetical protein K2173_008809 [Erythroxylum novogranatense]|uniref:Retrotransposon gag domain-containing protein n=1 Tax=Erythroxylum novogranatense TaxID=1862640 RepID=A0AAV8SL71_9ROSI|nr:hypothetical protein K2173_008809 [Erythroxylum novogranatense]
MQIPAFKGRNDAEAYLEWERKVDMIFKCHNFSEEKKVKLVAVEFTDYALIWWDQFVTFRRRNGERPINTWAAMKACMRKRFVPSYHYREMHQKLQRLTQGSKSVEDYHKEMEIVMIRANIVEDPEATMARFLSGLNRVIANVVELQHYLEIENMVNMAMKVERQLKARVAARSGASSNYLWNSNWPQREEKSKNKGVDFKEAPKKSIGGSEQKGTSSKHSFIKCFKYLSTSHIASKCPNRKLMYMKDNGVIDYEDCDVDDMPCDSVCDDEVEYEGRAVKGEALVVRRVLSARVSDEILDQKEKPFHSRCLVGGKVCNLIIDGDSCTNGTSRTMVKKLGLICRKHPEPYNLQ